MLNSRLRTAAVVVPSRARKPPVNVVLDIFALGSAVVSIGGYLRVGWRVKELQSGMAVVRRNKNGAVGPHFFVSCQRALEFGR